MQVIFFLNTVEESVIHIEKVKQQIKMASSYVRKFI